MEEQSDAASKRRVIELIKDMDYAMFATRSATDGTMHARPMAYRSVEGDGDLWFFTKLDSRKVEEIKADPHTLVCFADPKNQNYVTVTGESHLVTERALVTEHWTELYRAWFPGGPDDRNIVLLRVRPQHAEYWDTRHPASWSMPMAM